MKKLIQITILVVFMVSCALSGLKEDYKSERAQAIQPPGEVGANTMMTSMWKSNQLKYIL